MRKTIATVSALAALAAAGVSAGPAAADDPNARYDQGGTLGGSNYTACETPWKSGVLGQYGASGYYLDGCTVRRSCPATHIGRAVRYCVVNSTTTIRTSIPRGDYVTLNGRIRTINSANQVIGWRDRSCAGWGSCTAADTTTIAGGQDASVQCNGVRSNTWDNLGLVRCKVEIKTPVVY